MRGSGLVQRKLPIEPHSARRISAFRCLNRSGKSFLKSGEGSETTRVHHLRERCSGMAVCGTRAAFGSRSPVGQARCYAGPLLATGY